VSGTGAPDLDIPPVEPGSPRKAIALAVIVAACFAAVYLTPLREWVREVEGGSMPAWLGELRALARDAVLAGPLVYVTGGALAVAVGVPRLAVAMLGGAVFGWIEGTVLAQAGTLLGCWATFALGRSLGHAWVASLVARRFPRAGTLLGFISRHGFEANVVLRLTPIGNAFATNLLFAVSRVRLATFLAGTFVGVLPTTIIAALVGSAAKGTELAPRLLGSALGLALLTLGTVWWTRKLRREPRRDAKRAADRAARSR
jgi:uncharacterized membrane protein YdjX (TVP38/TMEM64 family)